MFIIGIFEANTITFLCDFSTVHFGFFTAKRAKVAKKTLKSWRTWRLGGSILCVCTVENWSIFFRLAKTLKLEFGQIFSDIIPDSVYGNQNAGGILVFFP
jgi:hypothetical protein